MSFFTQRSIDDVARERSAKDPCCTTAQDVYRLWRRAHSVYDIVIERNCRPVRNLCRKVGALTSRFPYIVFRALQVPKAGAPSRVAATQVIGRFPYCSLYGLACGSSDPAHAYRKRPLCAKTDDIVQPSIHSSRAIYSRHCH